MLPLFLKGGPMMWPLLVLSVISLATVLERTWFIICETIRRQPGKSGEMIALIEKGDTAGALEAGRTATDFAARALGSALAHRDTSFTAALLHSAGLELRRFSRGLSILDTSITLAPLMGLLGTVTGMIRAFALLGGQELSAPVAITGGIAEALVATAFGLVIAIISLIPFNFLNTRLEQARHEIEDAGTRVELLLRPQQ